MLVPKRLLLDPPLGEEPRGIPWRLLPALLGLSSQGVKTYRTPGDSALVLTRTRILWIMLPGPVHRIIYTWVLVLWVFLRALAVLSRVLPRVRIHPPGRNRRNARTLLILVTFSARRHLTNLNSAQHTQLAERRPPCHHRHRVEMLMDPPPGEEPWHLRRRALFLDPPLREEPE